MSNTNMPKWAELVVLPIVCLAVALAVAGVVVALIGQDPMEVLSFLIYGALGTARGVSYTLYYTTTFIFTGLAVAVAFHGGLFNIGGEGQAIMGGLGTGLVALWLSAYRGSHVVITTIMFNFIASSVLVYLLVNHLRPVGTMSVESVPFEPSANLPRMHEALAWLGIEWPASPLNTSLFIALAAAVAVYLFLWRSKAGYNVRAVGSSASAAEYAGINAKRHIVLAMAVSGALAGMVGMNEIAGVSGKLLLEFVSGAGFTGIAVALMGRNHPVGIVFASLLFGALFQGGAEVAFEVKGFSRDMVVLMQGLVVLFSGAMIYVIAPWVAKPLNAVLNLFGAAHAKGA